MYEVIRVDRKVDVDMPVFPVSAAAKLTGMHPQTLRQYDRIGLVRPHKITASVRRYSLRDIEKLKYIHHLSKDEKINLEGIRRILELEEENRMLKTKIRNMNRKNIFSVEPYGDIEISFL